MKSFITHLLGILLLFTATQLKAQPATSNFEKIDQHALAAPDKVTKGVTSLAAYLTKEATTDLEKVRSFYVWMTANITYDVQKYLDWGVGHTIMVDDTKVERRRIMQETLKNKLAVCQGYSELFDALCKEADIPSQIVIGYSKSYGTHNIVKEIKEPDHTWNAVLLDDEWYLLDATWGSGFINQELTFTPMQDDRFFLMDPTELIYTHLPADPMWQLLDCPVSFETFKKDSTTIELAVAEKKVCFAFKDSIQRFRKLPLKEQELMTAQHSYDFNPTNKLLIGMAHFNYANEKARQLVEDSSLKGKNLDAHFKTTVKHRKLALNYLGADRKELEEALGMDEFNYAIALLKPINDLKPAAQLKLMDKATTYFDAATKHLTGSITPEGKDALNACKKNKNLLKKNRAIVLKNIEIEKYNQEIRRKNQQKNK